MYDNETITNGKTNVINVKENQNIALFMSPAFVTDNFEKGRHNDNNHTKNYHCVTSFLVYHVLITERKPNGNESVDRNTTNVESGGGGCVNPQH